ncbi:MAG: hypothetical protein IPH45_03765 [Bacteroidales bacterium]|nr:hypothetical protein [Bacteroidales bacterium]
MKEEPVIDRTPVSPEPLEIRPVIKNEPEFEIISRPRIETPPTPQAPVSTHKPLVFPNQRN